MNTLSENLCIFATMLHHCRGVYQGEQLDFDPSENLENSKYKGDKLMKSCSVCSSIYQANSRMEWAYNL